MIELTEAYMQKDILHLSYFSIFFLICSFQVNLSRHKDVMKSDERVGRLFVLALFSLTAAFLELVDLGFDQLVNRLRGNQELISWHQSICILEVIFGIIVILMLVYSPTECWLRCVQLPATTRQQVFNYQSVAKSLKVLTD